MCNIFRICGIAMEQFRYPFLVRILNFLFIIIALLAIASFVLEFGFYLPEDKIGILNLLNFIIILYFVLFSLTKLALVNNRYQYLKTRWFNYLLVFVLIIEAIIFLLAFDTRVFSHFITGKGLLHISKLYIVVFQITLFLSILAHSLSINRKVASQRFHPARVLLGSFFIIIIIGALFLLLPRAAKPGIQISFLDALFTSTSATCVTGLTVVDTSSTFSLFGQIIILILIQIGGLGLMTYASFFALILGQNISIREKMLMRDVLDTQGMDVIGRLLISTVLFTIIMEATGAILIFLGLAGSGFSFGERLYSGIFHSISAFCNAGFSIYPDNLMSLNQNYLVVTTISWLIIFGGLGFPVILNLLSLRLFSQQTPSKMLSVQTRLVLSISIFLILSGMLFILIAENHNTLLGLSLSDKILNAFFLSVTPRTAGFNTLDISQLAVPTSFFIFLLMFIGASPGSTGGGIKTTTLAVLFAGVWSVIRGRNRMELFKKDIPFMVLNRAIVIFIFSIFFIFLCVLFLTFFEDSPFMDLIFEAVSAFGTVGLSRGVTPFLSAGGKITIIFLMFFGRLGALTISLAVTRPKETYHYTYPSENVMVG